MEALGPDGLALAYNPQAALFGQACHEMRLMVGLTGGDPAHVGGLPGAGDLYVTVSGGRTVRLGKLLGQGIPFSEAREILAGVTLESVQITTRAARALTTLERRGLARCADFPLLMHLDRVLNHAEPVAIPWDDLFAELRTGSPGAVAPLTNTGS
jgi:glycerol-3-phosphate dehydrogenase (NAD(P)+)